MARSTFVKGNSLRVITVGRDSSVGIATSDVLDGPGIESRWGKNFRTRPDWPWGSPSLLYNGYLVIPGGKTARGVALTTHPHLAPSGPSCPTLRRTLLFKGYDCHLNPPTPTSVHCTSLQSFTSRWSRCTVW